MGGRRDGRRDTGEKEADRMAAMRNREGRGTSGANLHQSPGLTDDGVLQAVQDEAVDLLQDPHWGLSNLPHQGIGPVHCG